MAELLRQQSLEFVVVKIRKVDGAGGLLANCLHHAGMGVAESVDPKAGYEVQIAVPLQVEEEDSFAALQDDGIAVVGRAGENDFRGQ